MLQMDTKISLELLTRWLNKMFAVFNICNKYG